LEKVLHLQLVVRLHPVEEPKMGTKRRRRTMNHGLVELHRRHHHLKIKDVAVEDVEEEDAVEEVDVDRHLTLMVPWHHSSNPKMVGGRERIQVNLQWPRRRSRVY
jgi:hypothetical protein